MYIYLFKKSFNGNEFHADYHTFFKLIILKLLKFCFYWSLNLRLKNQRENRSN